MDKYLRQRDENECRSRSCLDAIGEACRENDQTGNDRDKCIEYTDTDRFAAECKFSCHVTAEDLHRCNTERQREERLIHRRGNDISETDIRCTAEIREQVEFNTFRSAGQTQ